MTKQNETKYWQIKNVYNSNKLTKVNKYLNEKELKCLGISISNQLKKRKKIK